MFGEISRERIDAGIVIKEQGGQLATHPGFEVAYQRRGKECKGAISGEVSRACESSDAALSAAVVAEIRGGLAIPPPEHLP